MIQLGYSLVSGSFRLWS